MAVSQYLRPGNLVDTVKGYLTPDLVRGASSLVGESESSTHQALHGAVPGLLGGLLNFSSTNEGASSLANMVRDGGYGAALENPGSLFGGGATTSSVMSVGQSLIGKIFGNKSSSVTDAIASSSGVKSSSANTLMSLLAPLTLGVVGKMASSQGGMNASGIANLLRSQRGDIAEAAPSGISQILGLRGGSQFTTTSSTPTPTALYEERGTSERKWLPWLLIGLAAIGLLAYLLSRGGRRAERAAVNTTQQAVDTTRNAMNNVPLPGGTNLSVPQGSINDNLARFLASGSQDLPKTFVFDHLNFDSASAQLTPDSGQTVSNLASILKAYPNAKIQLSGYTDNTGSPQTNQQLSLDRANAVKAMLVSSGVSADRITTMGYGQDRPVASNDTEQGRAQNRRTELTVTSK